MRLKGGGLCEVILNIQVVHLDSFRLVDLRPADGIDRFHLGDGPVRMGVGYPLQRGSKLTSALVTVIRVLGQGLEDDSLKFLTTTAMGVSAV